MNIPRLEIHTTRAQIDLKITEAKVDIEQPKAVQDIEQPKGVLEIRTTRGHLEVDSTQAREDLGLYSAPRAIKINAEQALQAVKEGMSRTVQEGNQMMDLKHKGNVISQIAKQRYGPKKVESEIKFIPSVDSVKIENTPGTLSINYTPSKVKINVQTNKPVITYTPWDVETFLVQKPSITIDVVK
ncbi:DUF6470 family protein [Rummeliibacillus pycnus]|uniref:DUF6470 family protein n=1 Tax=Rummeliibacillus pycnus TaxID=101070 RepID=UPI000C9D1717|nr:DUF6470 family protein [Rummeliibacillus pycnus]